MKLFYATEQDLEDILRSFKDVGDEYRKRRTSGRTHCEEKGIELYY
jgi:glycerol-3-phosphate cytidylyltransferase